MLTSLIVRVIDVCTRYAWQVVVVGLVLAAASGVYTARHFAINSDISALLSNDIGWRQRELAFEQAFRRFERIFIVVEAPTAELASEATAALTQELAKNTQRFHAVTQLGGGEFFAANGLLFQSSEDLKRNLALMVQAEPLIHDLATDPSLRGLIAGLEDGLLGIQSGRLKLDDFTRVFNTTSDTLEKVIKDEPASFSWRVLAAGHPAAPNELRGFIDVLPVLDYRAIEPGHAATAAIRQAAAAIAPKFQATVRLTGPVAMADEEFATIKEGARAQRHRSPSLLC